MTHEPKIGVYICECGINIGATVDVLKVTEFAKSLPNVAVSKYYKYMCSEPGQMLIKNDIRELGLNRVVVASCSPRMHEPTFRAVCESAGLNPYCFEMANIREQCSWVHHDTVKATEKAMELVAGSVARASKLEPLERMKVPVTPAALVIGGGIAGIQAALDIADMGYKTYLVEREPSIGGRFAQLSKIFPLENCAETCRGSCAYCHLIPKMLECYHNPKIEILTYSEIESVDGYIGNFKVKVRKRPTYVSEKCVKCGICVNVCPLNGKISNEFDFGFSKRGAIYLPFPEAIPPRYVIDRDHCLYFTNDGCKEPVPCQKICEENAIDFKMAEEAIVLNVGAIIVATGYDFFDPLKKPEYMYQHPQVVTSLEFERLMSIVGPTGGELIINGIKPRKFIFIQCVGSRDKSANEYCSRVCCMYTAKQAYEVKKKIPDAEVTIYYTDLRTFGKGHEEFYNRVQDEGVMYRMRKLDDKIEVLLKNSENDFRKIESDAKGANLPPMNLQKLVVSVEGHPDIDADLVVLATGIVPRKDAPELAKRLRISQSADGFMFEAHPKLQPLDSFTSGVFLAGCCQSPKDIPDTVAQASGAAARACAILAKRELTIEPIIAVIDEILCIGCGRCEATCEFGAIKLVLNPVGLPVAQITHALCRGCGACTVACPTGAISARHFDDTQIISAIEALGGKFPG
jgi:heterodisulfide reductase subunit A